LPEMAILLLCSFSAMTPVRVPTAASSLSIRKSSADHGAAPLRKEYFVGTSLYVATYLGDLGRASRTISGD
jgi:hypothetical protein